MLTLTNSRLVKWLFFRRATKFSEYIGWSCLCM